VDVDVDPGEAAKAGGPFHARRLLSGSASDAARDRLLQAGVGG
jgi:hypothetical protein